MSSFVIYYPHPKKPILTVAECENPHKTVLNRLLSNAIIPLLIDFNTVTLLNVCMLVVCSNYICGQNKPSPCL